MDKSVDILWEDEHIIVVNKPPGILIHRTPLSEDKVFLLQVLRNQLGYKVFTAHRIDRATSGVVLFGKSPDIGAVMQQQFMERLVEKTYLALVRGWMEKGGLIDYPLKDEETGQITAKPALTYFQNLGQSEIEESIGNRYATARFSLLSLTPKEGRRHQIRKHLSHVRHPIIGDKRHGDVKHNTYFREHFDISRMLLHAQSLSFHHPVCSTQMTIHAPIDESFHRALVLTGLDNLWKG